MYNNLLQGMTSIATSPNMDAASKETMTSNFVTWLEGGLGLIGGVTGYDLGSLLDFTGAEPSVEPPAVQPPEVSPPVSSDTPSRFQSANRLASYSLGGN
jgi:hypothetical protein